MCEPECKVCWFQATNKELEQLKTKSIETNSQLQEAVRSVLTVQNAVEDIIRKCNLLEKLGEVKPDYLREKPILKEIIKDESGDANVMKSEKHLADENPRDDVLFVSISSGLTSEGTFWCRYWTTDVPFNDSRLHQISDELGWMEKDLSVEKAEGKVSDQLVFCYSQVHGLYLRAVILKYAPPDDTEVRFLDLGRVEFVSANITFYILPEDHAKHRPFLNMFCSLYMEESKPIPREAKWCFRDITEEKVLIARVINTTIQDGLTCHHVEMKTMVGEHKTINKEIMNKILEYEELEKRKAEEKQKSSRKKSVPEESKVETKDTVVACKNATHSTERLSLVKEYLLNQKRTKPRLLSETMFSNTKVDETRPRSKSSSNIFDIDPSLINLYDGMQVANGKEKCNAEWWEKIPDERRDLVPKRLPPVKNMFYSKRILRMEKWNEVELMNVDDLLKSESKMIFYAFQLCYDAVEMSFNGNFTYFNKNRRYAADLNNIEMNMGNVSQYFFLLNEDTNGMPPDTYQIFGLARVETMKRETHGILLYVSYYSLSNIGECKIEFPSKGSSVLDLTAAKILVTKIKLCLESGEARPQFMNYYPWCGIPPLVKLVKPTYPAFHRRNQNKNNKRQDDYNPRKQNKGRSFRDKPKRKSSLENWRSGTSECSSVIAMPVATACNMEKLSLKTLNSDLSSVRSVENSGSNQDKYIVPSESESCWISPRDSLPTCGDSSTSTPNNDNSCDNFDDSNLAKIVNGKHNIQNERNVVSVHGQQPSDKLFHNGEVLDNHTENVTSATPVDLASEKKFKPIKILQRPKKDDGIEVCNPDSTSQEFVPLQQSVDHKDQDDKISHSLEKIQLPDIMLKEERPSESKIGYYDDSGLWLPRNGPSNDIVPKKDEVSDMRVKDEVCFVDAEEKS